MFDNSALVPHMDGLRRFGFRLTGNRSDAEDLVQSTLLRAVEKKHLFEEGTQMFSWLSKIMFNIFASQYRRKSRFETQYDPESHIDRESVEASQDIKVELQNVQAAMNRLSDDHRAIIEMICVEGMQYNEVSEALNIPVGTVRSRLSRARESLTSALETRTPAAHVLARGPISGVPQAWQVAQAAA